MSADSGIGRYAVFFPFMGCRGGGPVLFFHKETVLKNGAGNTAGRSRLPGPVKHPKRRTSHEREERRFILQALYGVRR